MASYTVMSFLARKFIESLSSASMYRPIGFTVYLPQNDLFNGASLVSPSGRKPKSTLACGFGKTLLTVGPTNFPFCQSISRSTSSKVAIPLSYPAITYWIGVLGNCCLAAPLFMREVREENVVSLLSFMTSANRATDTLVGVL
jgi:hypothetical protein